MGRGLFVAVVLLSLSGTSAVFAAPSGAPIPLAPHKAVYELSLSRSERGGVVGATGEMTFKVENACSGWTTEARSDVVLRTPDGPPVKLVWEYSAWETSDGREYSFVIRSTQNGRVIEELEGSANLTPAGTGSARFREPGDETLNLSKGTLFPNAHSVALIEAARRGEAFFGADIFDGSHKEGATLMTVAIGGADDGKAKQPVLDNALLKTPSWRLAMAVFSPSAEGEEDTEAPSYEVVSRFHENGVTQDMVQDFGSFALRSTLKSLEKLDDPICGP